MPTLGTYSVSSSFESTCRTKMATRKCQMPFGCNTAFVAPRPHNATQDVCVALQFENHLQGVRHLGRPRWAVRPQQVSEYVINYCYLHTVDASHKALPFPIETANSDNRCAVLCGISLALAILIYLKREHYQEQLKSPEREQLVTRHVLLYYYYSERALPQHENDFTSGLKRE